MTVSPAGLRDIRVAAEPIPWRAIKSISTWQMQRQMVLVVAIDPAEEATPHADAPGALDAHRQSQGSAPTVSSSPRRG